MGIRLRGWFGIGRGFPWKGVLKGGIGLKKAPYFKEGRPFKG